MESEDEDDALVSDNFNDASLMPCTDGDVLEIVDRLAGFVGTEHFSLRDTACGFKHQPHGLLMQLGLRPHVKPSSKFMHDALLSGRWHLSGSHEIVAQSFAVECIPMAS